MVPRGVSESASNGRFGRRRADVDCIPTLPPSPFGSANMQQPPRVFLASTSPRRRKILENYCPVVFRTQNATPEEHPRSGNPDEVRRVVLANARQKCLDACQEIEKSGQWTEGVIVGADTLKTDGHRTYEKPRSMEEAVNFIKALAKPHQAITGVCLLNLATRQERCFTSVTTITLRPLDDAQIGALFAHMNPLDKAGAYNIDEGAEAVANVEGSRTGAQGLPLEQFEVELPLVC
ncbi:putative septum formation protein Maf [Paratrimastix pyriformis]|uniref:Septum formation protein Maf n=1 Tax=Paratrimastix pyriformis TaxID=342808 RepID=A0ABQ8UC43_9EUKA|nr:putative septum formation protein Maf [Paratrimastix pyriformis]